MDELLAPPTQVSHVESLRLSQLAPKWLRSQAPSSLPYPLSLLTTSESAEQWQASENLMVACLRTGDDETAYICLEQLSSRFGPDNERVQALRGIYDEATAADEKALLEVLKGYEAVLEEEPANVPVRKRRVALLKGLGRVVEATKALVELLDSSPVDAEAWAELAELYFVQAMYSQAVFCLEEVLLITPNAWNVCASYSSWLLAAPLLTPRVSRCTLAWANCSSFLQTRPKMLALSSSCSPTRSAASAAASSCATTTCAATTASNSCVSPLFLCSVRHTFSNV